MMLTKLPKPIRLFYCRHCKDWCVIETDRHGDYCADCQYPTDWPNRKTAFDVK